MFNYDPNRAAQVKDYDTLPAGEYVALISDVEDKESQQGGNFLKLTLTVMSGKHANWTVTDIINYNNRNPKAEEIAYRTLKKISRCVFGRDDQRFGPTDLIGKKIKIVTKVEDDGQYQNARVRNYLGLDETAPVTTPAKAGAKPLPKAQSALPSESANDDDVPF